MFKITLKLTGTGRRKLNNITRQTELFTKVFLKDGVEKITRQNIVALSPTYEEEERVISQGVAEGFGMVGGRNIPDRRRFIKSGFKWVRDRIGEEKVSLQKKGNVFWAKFGSPARINRDIGFGWLARTPKGQGGGPILRKTTDAQAGEFWSRLIEAWEYGGSRGVFMVKPRGYPPKLCPEKGIYTTKMTKQIGQGAQPWAMFKRGYEGTKGALSKELNTNIKTAVKNKFGK